MYQYNSVTMMGTLLDYLIVILKNIIKVTPIKSIIEATDPKAKRNYL